MERRGADEGDGLNPSGNGAFARGGSGLLSVVVPAPWAGVWDGKSAKSIRTFVPGH